MGEDKERAYRKARAAAADPEKALVAAKDRLEQSELLLYEWTLERLSYMESHLRQLHRQLATLEHDPEEAALTYLLWTQGLAVSAQMDTCARLIRDMRNRREDLAVTRAATDQWER